MEKSEWLTNIEKTFQNEKFTGFQLRSYRPDRFLKMSERIYDFQKNCETCRLFQKETDDIINHLQNVEILSESVFQIYISLFRKITEHLRFHHHLKLPHYYSSVFTLVGMITGLITGFLIWYIFNKNSSSIFDIKTVSMIAGFMGLVIGRIFGRQKDRKVINLKKRLF